jgi:hypothetical protein
LFGGLNSKAFMDCLSKTYKLKDGSVEEPDKYLGADIGKYTVNHDYQESVCYSMSSDSYLKKANKEVECKLHYVNKELKKKVTSPMASGYRPELDDTPYLNVERASYFMSLMGILRWAIELGCINIMVEAGLLSRFQAAPREGHLEQMFHIMAYFSVVFC